MAKRKSQRAAERFEEEKADPDEAQRVAEELDRLLRERRGVVEVSEGVVGTSG